MSVWIPGNLILPLTFTNAQAGTRLWLSSGTFNQVAGLETVPVWGTRQQITGITASITMREGSGGGSVDAEFTMRNRRAGHPWTNGTDPLFSYHAFSNSLVDQTLINQSVSVSPIGATTLGGDDLFDFYVDVFTNGVEDLIVSAFQWNFTVAPVADTTFNFTVEDSNTFTAIPGAVISLNNTLSGAGVIGFVPTVSTVISNGSGLASIPVKPGSSIYSTISTINDQYLHTPFTIRKPGYTTVSDFADIPPGTATPAGLPITEKMIASGVSIPFPAHLTPHRLTGAL